MKSRNLKAIFASVLTVALLATAMTGFAADATVATTTTYNTADGKVAVTTDVTGATQDSEVTYLVKSGDAIVYIDQETAVNGAVSFDYKIAQEKITNYASTVQFGTDADDTFTGTGTADLGLVALPTYSSAEYTITYAGNAVVVGIGEKVTANITANDGYEITDVAVNGTSMGAVGAVGVGAGDEITVTTQAAVVEPEIQTSTSVDATENSYVAVIKKVGAPYQVGVIYNDELYPSVTAGEYVAVKLILPEDANVDEATFTPYFIAEEGGEESTVFTELN